MFGIDDILGLGVNFLSGRIGAGAEHGARTDLARKLQALYSPDNVGKLSNQYMDIFKRSPAYAGARNQSMMGAQSLGNRMNASFARRGLSNSGLAGVATPLAQSSYTNNFAKIDSEMFASALKAAMGNLDEQASAIKGGAGPGIGAGTWGRFLDSSGAQLTDMLGSIFKKGGQNNMATEELMQFFGKSGF